MIKINMSELRIKNRNERDTCVIKSCSVLKERKISKERGSFIIDSYKIMILCSPVLYFQAMG